MIIGLQISCAATHLLYIHFLILPWSELDPGPGGAHVATDPGGEAGVGERLLPHAALVVIEPVEDQVLVLGPAARGTTRHAPRQLVRVQGDVATLELDRKFCIRMH